MGNFLFKIIINILADRLAGVADRIVSCNQFGFICDQHIEKCIAAASDFVNLMGRLCFGGNVVLKIDIGKAFDMMDWNFIFAVFSAFGFSKTLIKSIFSSFRISTLLNGSPMGYFPCSRGVHQCDPLSLLIFVLQKIF